MIQYRTANDYLRQRLEVREKLFFNGGVEISRIEKNLAEIKMKLNTAAFKAEDDAPSILMGNEREWRPEGPEPEILPSDPPEPWRTSLQATKTGKR